jgi:hypothetical protein
VITESEEEEEDTEEVVPEEEKLRKMAPKNMSTPHYFHFPKESRSLPWVSNSGSLLR